MKKDYYDILGIDKKASKDDIKKAFRKLAHKYHPDKKGGDAGKFSEASEAYTVLTDDKKRAEYDTYGRVFNEAGGPGGSQGGPSGFEGFDFSGFARGAQGGAEWQDFDIGDIFSEFFGGNMGTRSRVRRGHDISIDIELSFRDSIFGAERSVLLTKTSTCDKCSGSGAEPQSGTMTCPTCNGKGSIRETRKSFLGNVSTSRVCDKCFGSGKIPKEKCTMCSGMGVKRKQEEISIKVPAGIEDGEMIRMSGAGEAISGGTSGDLYIKIHVISDKKYVKDGANIKTELSIKLTTALTGGEYDLETLDGSITLKIPEGITHGEVLRVKGKGVPMQGGKRGDMMVKVKIEFPKSLSKNAKKAIEELKKEGI